MMDDGVSRLFKFLCGWKKARFPVELDGPSD